MSYTTATIPVNGKSIESDGRVRLDIVYTGDASEPAPASVLAGDPNVSAPRLSVPLATNEVLAFNFNGTAVPSGLSVSAWFAWVES